MYRLIIIWNNDGTKETYDYLTLEEAERVELNMRQAFGGQIWTGIMEV